MAEKTEADRATRAAIRTMKERCKGGKGWDRWPSIRSRRNVYAKEKGRDVVSSVRGLGGSSYGLESNCSFRVPFWKHRECAPAVEHLCHSLSVSNLIF